jgi:hypothetical protein
LKTVNVAIALRLGFGVTSLFLNVFDLSKNIFQNLVRRGVSGGARWCRNMKAQRKNSKLEFKYFSKFFSHKKNFFGEKNISKSCGGGVGVEERC